MKPTLALFKEINEVNLGLSQVRCFIRQRTVVVSAEVEIESLEEGQLGRLVKLVEETAHHVGELIVAVYGGNRASVSFESDEEHVGRG